MKSDSWFYRVFRDLPGPFFGLLGMPKTKAREFVFEAAELKDVALRLDGVYRPLAADETFVFVEANLYTDQDFYLVWFAKILLYLREHRIHGEWRALVLFETRVQEPPIPPWLAEWFAADRVRRVFLDELPEFPDATLELAVLKLATASKKALPERAGQLATRIRDVHKLDREGKDLIEIIEALLVSNFPQMTREEIQKMLQVHHDIRESRIYKEGRQEGKLEGKLEQQAELIRRWLAKGMPESEVAELLEIDLATVVKIANTATKKTP